MTPRIFKKYKLVQQRDGSRVPMTTLTTLSGTLLLQIHGGTIRLGASVNADIEQILRALVALILLHELYYTNGDVSMSHWGEKVSGLPRVPFRVTVNRTARRITAQFRTGPFREIAIFDDYTPRIFNTFVECVSVPKEDTPRFDKQAMRSFADGYLAGKGQDCPFGERPRIHVVQADVFKAICERFAVGTVSDDDHDLMRTIATDAALDYLTPPEPELSILEELDLVENYLKRVRDRSILDPLSPSLANSEIARIASIREKIGK